MAMARAMAKESAIMTHTMLHSAMEYIRSGYKIFPCVPGGKEPLGRLAPHGCRDATGDEDQVRTWWSTVPDANIGVATGDGLVVIDVDYDPMTGLDGYQTLADLEAQLGSLPRGRRVRTPRGGMHIYLHFPTTDDIPNSTSVLGPGIDVRSDGGYVVGAGSQIDMVYYADESD